MLCFAGRTLLIARGGGTPAPPIVMPSEHTKYVHSSSSRFIAVFSYCCVVQVGAFVNRQSSTVGAPPVIKPLGSKYVFVSCVCVAQLFVCCRRTVIFTTGQHQVPFAEQEKQREQRELLEAVREREQIQLTRSRKRPK